ncbi:MAG: hypothetical protein OT477_11210 [Chloroflexi bacterium]|nr:hypothetical protein [Chloroflexota bacterium]
MFNRLFYGIFALITAILATACASESDPNTAAPPPIAGPAFILFYTDT